MCAHAHARTHTHAHTHACTHTRMHTHTHTHTHIHTHTHTPSQQWALSSEGVIKQHFPNNADRPLYLQCVTYNADGPPYLSHCSRDPKQQFELMPTGQLKYKPTGECLMWNDSTLTVAPCRDHDHSLDWNFVLPVTTAYS